MNAKVKQKFRKLRIGSPSRREALPEHSGRSDKEAVPNISAPSSLITDPLDRATASSWGSPADVVSSAIWSRAVQEVEQTAIWSKYCEIIRREQLSSISVNPNQHMQQVSAQQISEISQLVTKLHVDKRNTQNQSLRSFIEKSMAFVVAIKDAGSAVAALNPYASLGWSVLQLLLSAATASHAVQTECYEALPQTPIGPPAINRLSKSTPGTKPSESHWWISRGHFRAYMLLC